MAETAKAPPPQRSGLMKDVSTIASKSLGGLGRGVVSGAWTFFKTGLVVSAIVATAAFAFSMAPVFPWMWLATGALGSAAFGAVATGVVNLVGGVMNGFRDNFYRSRAEREMRRRDEAEQTPEQKQSTGLFKGLDNPFDPKQTGVNSYTVQAGGATGVGNPGVSTGVSGSVTEGKWSPTGSGVTVPAANQQNETAPMDATAATTGVSSSAGTSVTATSSVSVNGQGPSGGGSWEELVRKNARSQLQAR